MAADLIHVVEGGRVVESGTHEALIARQGLYAQCWQPAIGHPNPAAAG
jgi:ABC-type transport system involved in Fe-S cluster assembly fused permease/ATPase subunit